MRKIHRRSIYRSLWVCLICIPLVFLTAIPAGQVNAAVRTVRVGVYQNEPKIFLDEKGQASGFLVDLLKEIATRENWTLVYVPCEWEACLASLEAGQINLMPDVAYSPERDKIYDFHLIPAAESWYRVYATPGLQISRLDQLNGKSVSVLSGSIQQTELEQTMRDSGFKVVILPAQSPEEAFKLVNDGAASATVSNQFFGDYYYRKYGLVRTSIIFNATMLYYATAQGHNHDLLGTIDNYLGAWRDDPKSVYYSIQNRWLNPSSPNLWVVTIAWILGALFVLFLVAAVWIFLLRKQVHDRTRHLVEANQTLRESEERYRLISTVASDYMFSSRVDADGLISINWVAGAFEAITGFTFEEYIARGGWRTFLHPDDLAADDLDIEKLHANQPITSELRTINKSGQIVWVRVYAHPVWDAERNELVGINGAVQEITERKQAEEIIKASEKRLSLIFDTVSDVVFLLSVEPEDCFRFASINPAFLAVTGLQQEQVVGKRIEEVLPEATQAFVIDKYNQAIQENKTVKWEEISEYPTGTLYGEVTVTPFFDNTGTCTYLVGSVHDITENRRADLEIRELAEELHNSVDLLNITGQIAMIGGWEIILEDQKLNWTEEVYFIHEIDPGTPINVAEAINFYSPESQPVISTAVQACISSGTPWDLDLQLITAKGRLIWVHTLGKAERRNGKIIRIYGTFQDITERKLAEEKLLQQTIHAQALVRTASRINSNLDLNAVLSSVCEETAHALTVSVVALLVYDHESQTFSIAADYGFPDNVDEKSVRIPINAFPPDLSPISDAPIIIHDAQVVNNLPYSDLLQLIDIRSIVTIKIKNKETYIGSLSVYSIGKVRHFSDDEIALLEGLSNQAAHAITNANLFENTNRRLNNIEALRTIDSAISNSLDIHLTLKVVVEETIQQLGVDAVDILLFEPASNLLKSAVSQGFRTAAMRNVSIRVGEGIAGQIAIDLQRIFIPDMADYQGKFTRAPDFTGEDFVSYCGMPLRAKGQFIGVLEVFNRKRLNPDQDWFGFLESLTGQAAIAIDSIRSFEELQISNTKLILAYDATIEGWSRAMDLRDEETEGHTQRVTQLTIHLAKSLGIDDEQIVHIRRGALLHDMGKLGIPDRVLLKPGKLTDEEWVIMRKHPQYAYDMLSSITYLRPALEIPYCHHEKWDGSGYPRGLKGEEIPLAARIFAVIDVWDALTSDRPYRKAWSHEQTLEYIRDQTGTHFDPQVVKAFMEMDLR
jgi:PAS domain S-box-containing protein